MSDEKAVVVELLFGSHLYGLNTPESDKDYKGIVLPTAEDILLGHTSFHIDKSTGNDKSKNGPNDVDKEFFSLQRFIELAMKGETVAMDMLHSQRKDIAHYGQYGWIWEALQDMRGELYTKSMKSYVGYVRKQAAKYSIKGSRLAVVEETLKIIDDAIKCEEPRKFVTIGEIALLLPDNEHAGIAKVDDTNGFAFYEICGRKFQFTNGLSYVRDCLQKIYNNYGQRAHMAKTNEGVDWKAVSHAFRAGYQARDIYIFGSFKYPLDETDFILAVKTGQYNFEDVAPMLEGLVDEVEVLAAKSEYPDKVDAEKFHTFVRDIHYKIIMGDL